MTRTLEHDVTDYLHLEAHRVSVSDRLAEIEAGIVVVPLAAPRARQRRPLVPFIGAAASIALLTGVVLARHHQEEPIEVGAAAAAEPEATTTVASTEVTTTVAVTMLPLPAGARIQGIVPSCTTLDNVVFDCTIPAFPEDVSQVDMTGYVIDVVDDSSHVSGGCRSVSVDATRFTCYLGQRAVDEQIIGPGLLGAWAPQGYTAG